MTPNHIVETENEIIFEQSTDTLFEPDPTRKKQVTASYGGDDENLSRLAIRRASDRDKEMLSVDEDVELPNPIPINMAEVTAVNSLQKYMAFLLLL